MSILRNIGLLCFYLLVVMVGVTFCVSNRSHVDLTFFPFPYVVSPRLYIFTIVVFILGIFTGWLLSSIKGLKYRRSHKDANRRVLALENEIAALRSEQHIKPAQTLALK